jgi:hypothetical protein
MKKPWVIYLFVFIAYESIAAIFLHQKDSLTISVFLSSLIYIVFCIGIFGLAFKRKIFSNRIWQVVSIVSIVLFLANWLMMPLIYKYSYDLPLSRIGIIQLFSVPSIPLYIGVYMYAWRSANVWNTGT